MEAVELPGSPGNLAMGIASHDIGALQTLAHPGNFAVETVPQAQPCGDAVEEEARLGMRAAERVQRSLRRSIGSFHRGRLRAPHDLHQGTQRDLRGAHDRTFFAHTEGDSQAVAGPGVDAKDVVQEERNRPIAVEYLPGFLRMLLERFERRQTVQAYQAHPLDIGDAIGARCGFPAVPDSYAQGLVGKDLERNGSTVQDLSVVRTFETGQFYLEARIGRLC